MYYLKTFLSTLLACLVWIIPAQYNIDGLLSEYRGQIRSLQGYSVIVFLPDSFYREKKDAIEKLARKENGKLLGHLSGKIKVAMAFKHASLGVRNLLMQEPACELLTPHEFIKVLEVSLKERIFAWCIITFTTILLFAKLSSLMYP